MNKAQKGNLKSGKEVYNGSIDFKFVKDAVRCTETIRRFHANGNFCRVLYGV